MNTHPKIFLYLLLGITILSLNACGGASSKPGIDNNNSHPEFFRSIANASPSYSPSGDITQVMPTFSWKAIANATDYRFGHETTNDTGQWRLYYVTQNEAGCHNTGDTCAYTPTDYTFSQGVEKVWWVQPMVNGNWQDWSRPIIFTVVGGGSGNNPIPTQISPSGTINTTTPEFSWSSVSNAVEYKIGYEDVNSAAGWTEVSVSAAGANCASGQTCVKTISSTFSNQIAWWVKAKNANGTWSDWSAGLSFTIDTSAAQIPNAAFQFFCNGIDNRPALGSLDSGVIYSGKRYFVISNASNSHTLKVSDSNGNNEIDVETFPSKPNLYSIDGAIYITANVSGSTKYYRITANGGIFPISSFTTKRSDKFVFVNGFDFYILSSARPPTSTFMRHNPNTSTNVNLFTYFRGQVAFSTYYQNGVLYYSYRDRSVTTVTTLGMINSSSYMQVVSTCN